MKLTPETTPEQLVEFARGYFEMSAESTPDDKLDIFDIVEAWKADGGEVASLRFAMRELWKESHAARNTIRVSLFMIVQHGWQTQSPVDCEDPAV